MYILFIVDDRCAVGQGGSHKTTFFFSSSLKKELLGCKVIVSFLSVRPVIILGTV